MRKAIWTLIILAGLVVTTLAQERAVYLTADIPAKKNLTAPDIAIGGEAYLPLLNGRVVVKTELTFQDTIALLLNTPDQTTTDQLALAGTARIYLQPTEAKNRFFVEGGIAQAFFIDAPIEGINVSQAKSAFGLNFNNRVVPRFEFATQDFTGSQFFGREYRGEVEIFIPVDKVRFKLTPYIAHKSAPFTFNEYGVRIGFGRTF